MRLILFLLFVLLIDLYVYQGVKSLANGSSSVFQSVSVLFWLLTVVSVIAIITVNFYHWSFWPKTFRTYLFAGIFILYFSKLFVIVFLSVDDLIRAGRWVAAIGQNFFFPNSSNHHSTIDIGRQKFIVQFGFVVASIPFFSLIYGMIHGATDFRVRKLKLILPGLPDQFNGLKLVQVSDIHCGSFNSVEPLQKASVLIKELKPDVLLITGDVVNNQASEFEEKFEWFKELKAPLGVFSILGNHDYGDYYRWSSPAEKQENFNRLIALQEKAGWRLLRNEHSYIEKDGAKIGLVGVENWSARLNFQRYGDLEKAVSGMEKFPVNILLSHDPSHWRAEVLKKYPQFDLTLSGHTHGFQFGIDIPGFRWSPVKYVYREWADMYNDKKQLLYVNRGLGFLGYPGRVGIKPEITFFELVNA